MFKLLANLRSFLKSRNVTTDSVVFRMHNVFTTTLLMSCSLVITANQFVGNPIYCLGDIKAYKNFINTFCWITSTFTMPDAYQRQVGKEVAAYGVANDFGRIEDRRYHTYYQWVCFVLFFQALLCYTPGFLWKIFEGGLMNTLVMGLNLGICSEKEKDAKKKAILGYLKRYIHNHNLYAIRYWFCELLCFINIIGQLYLMDRFFDGEFLTYGWKVLNMSSDNQENRMDPMVYIFPRMTKCTFHKFGPSGSIQLHDSLCLLPLNIVNEKTYIFIWFWYAILLALLTLLLIYRIAIIFYPRVRSKLMKARNRAIPYEVCESITRNCGFGDWWVLYVLGMNMDPLIYREIIMELSKKIDPHSNRLTH
uniref:Innexin n=1 Tax=Cuerna arida TaxID=1464854 RepID=A0A1B6FA42_9HEMI